VTVLDLSEVRGRAASALAPELDTDPDVYVEMVDAVYPPCLLLDWGDPWLTFQTIQGGAGACEARFVVWAVASRVTPGPGIEMLEGLVAYVVARLRADAYPWPVASSVAPRVLVFSKIPYLAARLEYNVPIGVEARVPTPVLAGGGS
jgi:hypothetical protein